MFASIFSKTDLQSNVRGVLGVGNGGTGADNAADARDNLDIYSTSEVDSIISSLSQGWEGTSTTYALLPAAADHNGEIWLVTTTTGIAFINQKEAGLYVSNGSVWTGIGAVESGFVTEGDIGVSVQAYNSYLSGINQALSASSSPTFAGLSITGKTGGVIPYFSGGTLTTSAAFIFSSGVFRIGADIGVTNGMSFGDTTLSVESAIGQGSSNKIQFVWNYNATAASAYGEIKTKSGSNDLRFMMDGGKAIFANTALALYDTASDHYVQFKINEDQAANRTLNWILGASDRTITLSGNPTLGDWFDQAVKTTSSPTFAQLNVDNIRLDGNTISTTDAAGIMLIDTNGGSIAVLDNMVCGASGTALTSGFTTSRSSNPRIWLYETGAAADSKVWEHLANSGTYRFRVANDALTNSVSIYDVTRSGLGSLVFTVPIATVTISSLLNVDNLRLDGNTFSSTNTNGNIIVDPNGTGQIQFGTSASDYLQLRLGGGNQYGYLFGSFAGTGDGIELGYNFYYDSSGTGQIGTTGGGTAYFQVGYGEFKWFVANAGAGNPTQKAYMSGSGNWTYSGSATYEDNKYIYWGTGQDSCIGFDGSDTIWNLQNAGTGKLFWQVNDSSTSGDLELVQYGSGDAGMTFTIASAFSYSIGVDNSDSDTFKISASSAIGTNMALSVNASKLVTVDNLAILQTPASAVAVASTHKLAVSLNGSTYYFLLTNV